VVIQVPAGELTSVEQSLVEHVRRGERLDLAAGDEVADDAAMRSWDESRTCRATVIRDILRASPGADVDPRGLQLRGGKISGRLDLTNLTTKVNLDLENCFLEEGILVQGAHLASVGLIGCRLEHPTEPPLDADRLTCSVLALRGARIVGHTGDGAIRLPAAHIDGPVDCDGASLCNDVGPAVVASNLQVGMSMYLRGFTATGAGDDGVIRLVSAHIGGQFVCTGAELRNDSGPALVSDGLQLDGDMSLAGMFTGTGGLGAVRLTGARIGGSLDCSGANLHNDSGPALHAHGLQVGQDMFLFEGFTATGAGKEGAVRLTSARIGGELNCDGATVRNDSGPGLRAFRLQVDGDMYLTGGFAATGSKDRGAVRLTGARIGGSLDCSGATLHNDSGPALLAYGIQVGQDIYFTKHFSAISGGDREVVNLRTARIGGAFDFEPEQLEHTDDPHKLVKVDGLIYTGVPGPNRGQKQHPSQRWRELLRHGTPAYAAQPYQQLAAGYKALGEDRQARQTLIAQRDDQLARTHPQRWERWWGRITKITLGYGYKPWRALWFLAGLAVVSCVLAWLLGAHGALAQTSKTATPGRPCTVAQQVSVGLDLNLPVGTSVARAQCDLTEDSGSVTAAWLAYVGWALRVLAWAFAALFIAGFTSAVRKT